MSTLNLSPEEILRKKEIDGGLVYDDDPSIETQKTELRDEPPVSEQKNRTSERIPDPATPQAPKLEPSFSEPKSLGKSETLRNFSSSDLGWKNIPMDILPTEGKYYPEGTRMAIRPSEVKEIRHFSTIDESDRLDLEEKLSYILDKCLRIDFPGDGVVSYKDLKQEDRFFIIMAIRDLTFVRGENSILLTLKNKCNQTPDCPFADGKIELRTGILSSYKIDDKVMEYYDSARRCFKFKIKNTGKEIEMFIPSIGVSQAIYNHVIEASKKNVNIDEGFIQIAPFLFEDWRDLRYDSFISKMRQSDYWTKEEYSIYFTLSEKIKLGTKMEINQTCPVCGDREVTADISFPDGIRSLFIISDIFRELL